MTNEPTDSQPEDGAPDSLRSLDGVDPPDQWDAILERASHPALGAPMVGAGHRLRPFLVAAVVVALAGIAGGLVLADRNDDRLRVASTPGTGVEAVDPPANALGRTWYLRRFIRNGQEVPIPEFSGVPGYALDLSEPGQVVFTACNRGQGPGKVSGDRLVLGKEWFSTMASCGPEGADAMALDEAMPRFLRRRPTIEVRGNQLTLRSGDDVAEWVSFGGDLPGVGKPPAEVVMQASGDSGCSLGLRPRSKGASTSEGVVTPGAASPPLVAPRAPNRVIPGTWHLAVGELTVEIHVPGTMVIDLVGERTETVKLTSGEATVWFTDDWVQVRSFPGLESTGPCDSFDVTVAGSSEEAQRNVALEIAERVVTGPRDENPAESSGGLDQTTSSTVPTKVATPPGDECAVIFDLGDGLDDGLMRPGPAAPSLGAKTGKVWHLSTKTQSIEIQVPSINLNGYGNRGVDVGAERKGWIYSFGAEPVWLQVTPGSTSRCGSFDVIVAGADDAANETLALDLGEAIELTST